MTCRWMFAAVVVVGGGDGDVALLQQGNGKGVFIL